jgi:SRSO17 transposase
MGITRAGVAPQWCGHTGKKDNCQAGVFIGYASRKGATFLDRRLYLPEAWFDEEHQTRWQDCQIPDEIVFQTKHELAARMVEDIMASGRLQAKSGRLRRGIWRFSCFPAAAGRDGLVVPG